MFARSSHTGYRAETIFIMWASCTKCSQQVGLIIFHVTAILMHCLQPSILHFIVYGRGVQTTACGPNVARYPFLSNWIQQRFWRMRSRSMCQYGATAHAPEIHKVSDFFLNPGKRALARRWLL